MKKLFVITILILVSALMPAKTFSQDNADKIKDGINKVYAMFNSGDFTGVENYIDAAYLEHQSKSGDKTGIETLVNNIKNFRKAFPDVKFTINDVIVSGNKAAVLNTFTGTNTGEFMGMPATNKKVSVMGIDYLYFNNDLKCTEHYGYQDDMGFMQQLGLMK